jgi:hypothetical protein
MELPERAWAIASHRALVLRMEPVPVSTLRASIGYRKGTAPISTIRALSQRERTSRRSREGTAFTSPSARRSEMTKARYDDQVEINRMQARAQALSLAHDHTAAPKEVVERAKAYIAFMEGSADAVI